MYYVPNDIINKHDLWQCTLNHPENKHLLYKEK